MFGEGGGAKTGGTWTVEPATHKSLLHHRGLQREMHKETMTGRSSKYHFILSFWETRLGHQLRFKL